MSGRAYRNKKRMVVQETSWWEEMAEQERAAASGDPWEEWSQLAVADLVVRTRATPECEGRAVSRSWFYSAHHETAVGEAGARELRQLTREIGRHPTKQLPSQAG